MGTPSATQVQALRREAAINRMSMAAVPMELVERAVETHDEDLIAQVKSTVGNIALILGELRVARPLLAAAAEHFAGVDVAAWDTPEVATIGVAWNGLGVLCEADGDYSAGRHYVRRVVVDARSADAYELRVLALSNVFDFDTSLGHLYEAAHGHALVRALEGPAGEVVCHSIHRLCVDRADGVLTSRAAFAELESAERDHAGPLVVRRLAILAMEAALDERDSVTAAKAARRLVGIEPWSPSIEVAVQEARLRRVEGDIVTARKQLGVLAKRSSENHMTRWSAVVLCAQAEVEIDDDDPDAALTFLDQIDDATSSHVQRVAALELRVAALKMIGLYENALQATEQVIALRTSARFRPAVPQEASKLILHERIESMYVERLDARLRRQQSLLGLAAHDLRGHLNTMFLLIDALEAGTGTRSSLIERWEATVASMVNIVEAIDSLARRSVGPRAPLGAGVDMVAIVGQAIEDLTPAADRKQQTIEYRGDTHALLATDSSGSMCQFIVSNLISNAVKYSEAGTTIQVELGRFESATGQASVRLLVVDVGQGMSADDLVRIGRPYEPGSASPTANEPSSGHGLFLVQNYLDEIGGALVIHSEGPGRGTTATLDLRPASTSASALEC